MPPFQGGDAGSIPATRSLFRKDKSLYTGITWNLKNRIEQHNKSTFKSAFTKGRLPVKLVYWEKFNDRFKMAKREKVIKDFNRLKKLRLVDSLHRTK